MKTDKTKINKQPSTAMWIAIVGLVFVLGYFVSHLVRPVLVIYNDYDAMRGGLLAFGFLLIFIGLFKVK
ncbi:MAG: hypothetical protein MUD08_14570 [Cytophagales bacterium]|jgi:hypothetical protein|nr:hypothetical protein [Cytophagales bacterium]